MSPRRDGRAGASGEQHGGPKVGFDWMHLIAYLLLSGAFIFTAHQNREQTRDILKTGSASCADVNDLRGTLRLVLMDQVDLAIDFPLPQQQVQAARVRALEQSIDSLKERPC